MRDAGNAGVVLLVVRVAAGDAFDLGHHRCGPLERRRVGQLHVDEQVALVLRRDEAGRHAGEAEVGQEQQAAVDDQHDDADAAAASRRPRRRRPTPSSNAAVEQLEEPAESEVEQPRQRIALLGPSASAAGRTGPG